jgi:hypothetical protein
MSVGGRGGSMNIHAQGHDEAIKLALYRGRLRPGPQRKRYLGAGGSCRFQAVLCSRY